MELDQEELQRKSEQLKEQKIKQIKHDIKCCLKMLNLPNEIKDIIISYSFDESKIETNYSLKAKVKEYCKTKKEYLISELDVSCVTSMNCLFRDFREFTELLDKWDTSNVIDMSYMFSYCKKFNKTVNFNTSNVIDMSYMFFGCEKFNKPVNFDTKNVISMYCMFYSCKTFNKPIEFNTENVIDINYMFYYCKKLNKPIKFKVLLNTNIVPNIFNGCRSLKSENNMLIFC